MHDTKQELHKTNRTTENSRATPEIIGYSRTLGLLCHNKLANKWQKAQLLLPVNEHHNTSFMRATIEKKTFLGFRCARCFACRQLLSGAPRKSLPRHAHLCRLRPAHPCRTRAASRAPCRCGTAAWTPCPCRRHAPACGSTWPAGGSRGGGQRGVPIIFSARSIMTGSGQ